MRHNCKDCNADNFRVIKTYPYEQFTLRHLKCNACGSIIYTREYIMSREEYCWKTFKGKTRLSLKDQ
jgi:uncharacterized Zn finger protein